MTFTEAAVEVLRLVGKPLHFKDITQLAIEKNLLSHVGKTPDVTMGARLSLQVKKEPDGVIVRTKPGVFALREWEANKGKKKGKKDIVESEPKADESEIVTDSYAQLAVELDSDEPSESDAAEGDEASDRASDVANGDGFSSAPPAADDEEAPLDDEERLRGQIAAAATNLFEEEDDDDQPLFGSSASSEPANGDAAEGGGRRRRRRRRRGKGPRTEDQAATPSAVAEAFGTDDQVIGYTEERDDAPARRAIVLDRTPPHPRRNEFRHGHSEPRGGRDFNRETPREARSTNEATFNSSAFDNSEHIEDYSGRELADFIQQVLQSSDRGQGPVAIRSIIEAAQRKGRVAGDSNLAGSQIAAAVRADNLRRQAAGQRVRFRLGAAGRLSLTDWALPADLLRLEQDALAAVERYREAARRVFAGKLQKDLAGPALIELVLTALERLGFRDIRPVRRAGLPGGESHFSAVQTVNEQEIRTAIVVRRDGREIGRERVIDLRGSLHHYGPASAGWLITTGQCLSGASEEAAAPGTTPIALFDAVGLARLLEQTGVGVISTRVELPALDLDLFESLRF